MQENIIKVLNENLENRKNFALVTIISVQGSAPRGVGTKMIVYENGEIYSTIGGGKIESIVIEKAIECINNQKSDKFSFDLNSKEVEMACVGKIEVFIDVYKMPLKVLILGGGHLAKSLSNALSIAEIPSIVVEDRIEFAKKENFPQSLKVINDLPYEAIKKENIDQNTYIVIMTRDHKLDSECLIEALKTKTKYIGMVASPSKIKEIIKNLKEKNIEIDERFYSPIGLKLGGKAPGEIAISIVAEILKVFYEKK